MSKNFPSCPTPIGHPGTPQPGQGLWDQLLLSSWKPRRGDCHKRKFRLIDHTAAGGTKRYYMYFYVSQS